MLQFGAQSRRIAVKVIRISFLIRENIVGIQVFGVSPEKLFCERVVGGFLRFVIRPAVSQLGAKRFSLIAANIILVAEVAIKVFYPDRIPPARSLVVTVE